MDNIQNKLKPLFIIITIFICGCSTMFFFKFDVLKTEHTENEIKILFSSEPELDTVINSFTFTKDEISQSGIFTKNEKEILFYPDCKIEPDHEYQIQISKQAENTQGVSLSNEYKEIFSTKKIFSDPKVISFSASESKIEFSFSEPVDIYSFDTAFSISPEANYFTKWDKENKNVSLEFTNPLVKNTRYFISISEQLKDTHNNFLKKEYTSTFFTEIPKTPFSYKIYEVINNTEKLLFINQENHLIKKDSVLKICFDTPVDLNTINSAIKFFPDCDYKIQKDKENSSSATISFVKPPEFNSTYKIEIANTITDIFERKMPSGFIKVFFDCPEEQNPDFLYGKAILENSNVTFSPEENFTSILFPVEKYSPLSGENSVDFYFVFSISEKADSILFFSAIDNIIFSSTQNCIDITPVSYSIISKKDFLSDSFYSAISNEYISKNLNQNISVVKISCTVKNKEQNGLIKISINKNLKDNLLNTLESEHFVVLNKK